MAFWGWAYEFSYFSVLGLDVDQTFKIEHYFYSSARYLAILFVVTIVVVAALKFFSKNIDKNDWETVKDTLNKTGFLEAVSNARFGFIITFGFWLMVFLFSQVEYLNWIGESFLLLIFFNIQLFFASLYLSPQYSRFSIVVPFVLSVGFCFSLGGMYSANLATNNVGKIRDDSLVSIVKENGKYVAVAKAVNIPLLFGLKKLLPI